MRCGRATFVLPFACAKARVFFPHESESSINCGFNFWIDLSGSIFQSCKLVSLEESRRRLQYISAQCMVILHSVAIASYNAYEVQHIAITIYSTVYSCPKWMLSPGELGPASLLYSPVCHLRLKNKIKLVLLNYLLSVKSRWFSMSGERKGIIWTCYHLDRK